MFSLEVKKKKKKKKKKNCQKARAIIKFHGPVLMVAYCPHFDLFLKYQIQATS